MNRLTGNNLIDGDDGRHPFSPKYKEREDEYENMIQSENTPNTPMQELGAILKNWKAGKIKLHEMDIQEMIEYYIDEEQKLITQAYVDGAIRSETSKTIFPRDAAVQYYKDLRRDVSEW